MPFGFLQILDFALGILQKIFVYFNVLPVAYP